MHFRELQTAQLSVESDVIKVQNARFANRINLHLALGGSFDTAPAVVPIK
jgi:multidrug efflux system outer membrane protein